MHVRTFKDGGETDQENSTVVQAVAQGRAGWDEHTPHKVNEEEVLHYICAEAPGELTNEPKAKKTPAKKTRK